MRACLALLLIAGALSAESLEKGIALLPLEASAEFPDGIEPGSVQRACAADVEQLRSFLQRRGEPLVESLVRPWGDYRACHIVSKPALEGFRASPDDDPIVGLHIAVDPMAFFVGRKPTGDALDIAKAVLTEIAAPLDVTVTVRGDFSTELWEAATSRHFGRTGHRVRIRASAVRATHPWTQDYIKSGRIRGAPALMLPRRLFEGRTEEGARYRGLLDGFRQEGLLTSGLSWDGGDVQFVRVPSNPSELLLAHGGSSRNYWGADLTEAEHSFVLRREFGADRVLDLGAIGPHADYLAAFLPQDRIALVAEPVHGDPRLFEAAAKALLELLGPRRAPRLAALVSSLANWDRQIGPYRQTLARQLADVRAEAFELEPPIDPVLDRELGAYAARVCSQNQNDCLTAAAGPELFTAKPELMRRITDAAADINAFQHGVPVLLSLMEAQLQDPPVKRIRKLDQAASDLRKLGFQVVRVPYLTGAGRDNRWPGVSYVNLLAFERTLFVPRFGLGAYEDALLERFSRKLGGRYRVVPVDARASLVSNGGVHCVFGIVRSANRAGLAP